MDIIKNPKFLGPENEKKYAHTFFRRKNKMRALCSEVIFASFFVKK